MSEDLPQSRFDRRALGLAVALFFLAAGLYARTAHFDFVNIDDWDTVRDNPQVLAGLTPASIRWAFTTHLTGNRIPLTWLSHMLDVELFGPRPGPHHIENALLHGLNTALLLWALLSLGLARGPAFAVALLFAVHPLRVESVAWISERKDLLSSAFVLAGIGLWARRVRRPTPLSRAAVGAAQLLGLAAKPMAVVLPWLLCVVDAWPLGRWRSGADSPLGALALRLREKAPLIALALLGGLATVAAQAQAGAVGSLAGLPWMERLANAGLGYFGYLRRAFWPAGLCVFYPHPGAQIAGSPPGWVPLGLLALAAVGAVTFAALRGFRRAPALAAGWLWFVGALVPVIGLVQVGEQALADRYAYLPLIGIHIATIDLGRRALGLWPGLRPWILGGFAVGVLALIGLTWKQTGTWRDSEHLFRRALLVTDRNYLAHNNLGLALLERGRFEEAAEEFEAALELYPTYLQANYNLGLSLEARGRYAEAVAAYRRVLATHPTHPLALRRVVEARRKAAASGKPVR